MQPIATRVVVAPGRQQEHGSDDRGDNQHGEAAQARGPFGGAEITRPSIAAMKRKGMISAWYWWKRSNCTSSPERRFSARIGAGISRRRGRSSGRKASGQRSWRQVAPLLQREDAARRVERVGDDSRHDRARVVAEPGVIDLPEEAMPVGERRDDQEDGGEPSSRSRRSPGRRRSDRTPFATARKGRSSRQPARHRCAQ